MTEQKADNALMDKIIFTYRWNVPPPSPDDDDDADEDDDKMETVITSYNVTTMKWQLHLTDDHLNIRYQGSLVTDGICNISYKLFCDNNMEIELYSSPITSVVSTGQHFNTVFFTPDGFMDELKDARKTGAVAKIVIIIALLLPTKIFFRPFDLPLHPLNKIICEEYPIDLEKDFRFEFLNDSDLSIKCPDGTVPALKMVLNVSSKFMKKHFKESKENEFVCEHKIDVVKPLIIYLHSLCFQMSKTYDLDFVDRLLKAADFFDPVKKRQIFQSIHQSLCRKFVEELPDFEPILQWLRIAEHYGFRILSNMICAIISNKFYFKWVEIFPENARNTSNQLFREIFGFESPYCTHIFESIESTFTGSLLTNVSFP
uniref:BTB domain-containing protein n=1 Tax=Panagrolaimus davidi TaxID=227884 RepID=A0A914R5R7_9BILA